MRKNQKGAVFSTVPSIAVSLDVWTAQYSTKSYISLTVHCISSVWELHSYCLSTKELASDNIANNIATAVEEMLCDWNSYRHCGKCCE